MTLHAVGTYEGQPGPVALFLHGWGADERDLASLAAYLPDGLEWLSARAPERHPAFGYAWYQLDTEDSFANVERIAAATEALWSFLDEAVPAPASVIPIGFSQGGLMASQLLRTRPERVIAAAILSGYVAPGSLPADAAVGAARPPVFWGRGSADAVIPRGAIESTEAFLPMYTDLEAHVYPGLAHSVSEEEIVDLSAFLGRVLG